MFDLGLFWQIIGVLGLLVIVVPWVIRTPPEEYRKAGYREGLDRAWKEAREERNNAIKQQARKDKRHRETIKKELLKRKMLRHRLDPEEGVVVEWYLGDGTQNNKYEDLI